MELNELRPSNSGTCRGKISDSRDYRMTRDVKYSKSRDFRDIFFKVYLAYFTNTIHKYRSK